MELITLRSSTLSELPLTSRNYSSILPHHMQRLSRTSDDRNPANWKNCLLRVRHLDCTEPLMGDNNFVFYTALSLHSITIVEVDKLLGDIIMFQVPREHSQFIVSQRATITDGVHSRTESRQPPKTFCHAYRKTVIQIWWK